MSSSRNDETFGWASPLTAGSSFDTPALRELAARTPATAIAGIQRRTRDDVVGAVAFRPVVQRHLRQAPRQGVLASARDAAIRLSGADPDVLRELPVDRRRYFWVGVALAASAAVTAFSAVSVMHGAAGTTWPVAVMFGLVIALLDVTILHSAVSFSRSRVKRVFRVVVGACFAVLVAAFTSTSLCLAIFRPEIDHQLALDRQDRVVTAAAATSRSREAIEVDRLEMESARAEAEFRKELEGVVPNQPAGYGERAMQLRAKADDLEQQLSYARAAYQKLRASTIDAAATKDVPGLRLRLDTLTDLAAGSGSLKAVFWWFAGLIFIMHLAPVSLRAFGRHTTYGKLKYLSDQYRLREERLRLKTQEVEIQRVQIALRAYEALVAFEADVLKEVRKIEDVGAVAGARAGAASPVYVPDLWTAISSRSRQVEELIRDEVASAQAELAHDVLELERLTVAEGRSSRCARAIAMAVGMAGAHGAPAAQIPSPPGNPSPPPSDAGTQLGNSPPSHAQSGRPGDKERSSRSSRARRWWKRAGWW